MGINLQQHEIAEVFGEHDPTAHEPEARSRWGETDAYAESERRTSSYRKSDWQRISAEAEAIERRFAELLTSGAAAGGAEARAAADAHRAHITRWFYDCSPQMHRALAEMYVADPRFAAHYEQRSPGLAGYVHDAIVAATS